MVLIAEDVGDTAYFEPSESVMRPMAIPLTGFFIFTPASSRGECAGSYGGHRRGAVALEDVADDAAYIGEVVGNIPLRGAVGKIAVAYLAAANATLGLSLACREGGKL